MKRLNREFFDRDTLSVARELLGKRIVFGKKSCIITETEAYIGESDPACHAARGMTKRNAVMYGKAGVSYVYFIYGMYFCLNFVTECDGFPAAVLIRGVFDENSLVHYDGPGKLCRFLGIKKEHSSIDVCSSDLFFVEDSGLVYDYVCTERIGICVGTDKKWRFLAIPFAKKNKR